MGSVRKVVASSSVVVLVVMLLGFGVASAVAGQKVSSTSLARYVVRTGEETGYSPSVPNFTSSATLWTKGNPGAAAFAKRLRGEGFRGGLIESTFSLNGGQGVSAVIALASPAAAKSEEQAELKEFIAQDRPVTRFTIKQLPTSEGYASTGSSTALAIVLFVEGSCVLLVSDEPTGTATNPRPPVIAGALKVYGRTARKAGVCA
jgi:hypothetical protein